MSGGWKLDYARMVIFIDIKPLPRSLYRNNDMIIIINMIIMVIKIMTIMMIAITIMLTIIILIMMLITAINNFHIMLFDKKMLGCATLAVFVFGDNENEST